MNKPHQSRLRLLVMLLYTLIVLPLFCMPSIAYAEPVSGLDDSGISLDTSTTDNATCSANGNEVTITSTGYKWLIFSRATTQTVKIKNAKSQTATLSFDYAAPSGGGSVNIDGNSVTTAGHFEKELNPNSSISIVVKSPSGQGNETLKITGITLIVDVDVTTTFTPAENGSYTVDEVEITESVSRLQNSKDPYELHAMPAAGYKFLGWYSLTSDSYISFNQTYLLYGEVEQSITAKFVPEDQACFETGGKLFTDLNDAFVYSESVNSSVVAQVMDGTLPAGDYTIPAGKTLLIPFDAANTIYTDSPATTTASETRKAFRTLTLAQGARVTVYGALITGAKQFVTGGASTSRVAGPYGHILMNEGSNITVESGGNVYAWGYITGDGSVVAKSGSSVYEMFQVSDWRGGSASSSMKNGVFPFSQYYVQNIEAPLTVYSGAKEYARFATTLTGLGDVASNVPFVADDGLFTLDDSSYFTKTYDVASDRLVIDLYGNSGVQGISLSVLGLSINSSSFILGINNNKWLSTSGIVRLPELQTA